jgi:hypothetical protein
MATRIYERRQTTADGNGNDFFVQDMTREVPVDSVPLTAQSNLAGTVVTTDEEQIFGFSRITPSSGGKKAIGFWSERVAEQVTISGDITFKYYAQLAGSGEWLESKTIRFKLWKARRGERGIEDFLGTFDSSIPITTTGTAYTFSAPVVTPFILYPGERVIMRPYMIKVGGGPQLAEVGTKTVNFMFGGSAATTADAYIEFTETFTFFDNYHIFYLRRTSSLGILNAFDMTTAQSGLALTTGVVTAASGVTERQWTRTAGGTPLEWISPRCKRPWMFTGAEQLGMVRDSSLAPIAIFFYAFESATGVNVTYRFKAYRWRNGVLTQCWQYTHTAEIGTTAAVYRIVPTIVPVVTPLEFREDDRVLIRPHITPIGAMGSGSATFNYDGVGSRGNLYLHAAATNPANGVAVAVIRGALEFKSEADPAADWTIPGGGTMMGVDN